MANYQEKETDARRKKFLATLAQAVNLASMGNQSAIHDGLSSRGGWQSSWSTTTMADISGFLEETTISKYMPMTETDVTYELTAYENSSGSLTFNKIYTLNDGTAVVGMWKQGSDTLKLLFDTNGLKAPNTVGRDVYWFQINTLGADRVIKVCDMWAAPKQGKYNERGDCIENEDFYDINRGT
ncbi:MAG: hypothetical protein LUG16_07820 [Candidatus Gastranaerophilales bacterium]|nr:hypothetical protein [Candidatus Gastranaerophilales bacterium]